MPRVNDADIECPFFLKQGEHSIRCEGSIAGTVAVQNFKSKFEKENHQKKFCACFGGRNCVHYRTVAVLYERGV